MPVHQARSIQSVTTDPGERTVSPALDVHALYDAHATSLRGLLLRLGGPGTDPDDMLQDVFVVALRRQAEFQQWRDARGWLHGISVKVAQAARRKARLRRFLGLESQDEPAAAYTPEHAVLQAEARQLVHAALEGLSEKKRTVFVLFELEGWSGEEIARAVGIPPNTVWTRLHHARREFLDRLKRIKEPSHARD
jgi:RNA polymerase sigma-70 factor (ECF subfamily)